MYYAQVALKQSDVVYDLNESYSLTQLSIAAEEHQFDYRIVPLTNVGFASAIGSQTLGVEVVRKYDFGTEVTTGIRGDRTDLGSGYAVKDNNIGRAYLKVSQGLFRSWGEKYNRALVDIAELKSKEQYLLNQRARQNLILSTTTKYYDLVLAKQLVWRSEKALERSRKHLAAAKARHSVGLVSKLDEYRAEIAALSVENSVQEKAFGLQRSWDTFRELLGIGTEEKLEVDDNIAWLVPVVPENWEEALLQNRLDWQAYRIQKQYAALNRYRTERETLPDLFMNFNLEQKGQGETMEEAANLDETNWAVQFELRSDLDHFSERSSLLRADMDMNKIKRQGRALKLKIIRQAREAFETLASQNRFYQISLKQLKQAESALELTQFRYERGLSDNLDVLDAEEAFSAAEYDIVQAMSKYNIAAIKLAYVLGVLDLDWLKHAVDKVQPIVNGDKMQENTTAKKMVIAGRAE